MSVPKPKICKGGGAKLVFAIYCRAFTHDVGARLASDSRLANLHTETQAARDMTLAVKLPTPMYEQFARLPHRCGNSRATWHHTVLPATRQR